MDHDGLGIVLHGCGDGDDGKAVGIPFENGVTGAEAEVCLAGGDKLDGAAVLGQWQEGYVEALGFVIAQELGGEKAAVLGLGVPIELEAHRGEAVVGCRLIAVTAGDDECEGQLDECGVRKECA